MQKLWRNYRAEFEIGERTTEGELIPREELVITPPFTLQLQTNSGINNTASNTGQFQFINLSEDNKSLLWLDVWNFSNKYIFMRLYAGYGDNMPLIFAGFVNQCISYKDGGSTEFITELVTNNNGMMQDKEYMNVTFTQGTKLQDIIDYATQNNRYIRAGYITPDIAPIKRDKTFIGQPLDLIQREQSGYNVFIANGEINILGDRDVIPGEIQVISDESGLLGSPKRSQAWVECDMVFEPGLRAGQAIALNSSTLPWMNRAYKIIQVQHKGVISPNTCGRLITTVVMTINSGADEEGFRELKKEVKETYKAPEKKGKWSKPTLKGIITSAFGKRTQPKAGASTNHKGIDIGVPLNTPIYAPARGTVQWQGIEGGSVNSRKGYGIFMTINHGGGVVSWYGHLSKYVVNKGQKVNTGDLIAYSGNTGNSTGAHLHFGIQEGSNWVNPVEYIGTY